MPQERFNNSSILYIEKYVIIDIEKVIDAYFVVKNRYIVFIVL